MSTTEFVDHYEVLQSSPNATMKTLESLFVHLTKLYHPEVPESGDQERFMQITTAFKTLRQPESRKAYDIEHAASGTRHQSANNSLSIAHDANQRFELLKLFYARRREDMKAPGLGSGGIKIIGSPNELEFHLWYLVEKGWLKRQDGGRLAITADGIDKLEIASRDFEAPSADKVSA